ncbi:hypothetical protein PV327_011266 [Microctonus hyperodae]|uniref:Uncharacterized protein n=1 Tax=Microctonus hyperodae TaxID=165561 RepID=A0AA39EWG3_MICHY|nr:hypothetical protein PV327_011266 [Microctonus hyperodae]
MTSMRGELYQKLFNTYKKCYPDKKSTIIQENVNKIWNDLKQEYKSDGKQFEVNIQNNIESLNQKITQNKATNLMCFISSLKPQNTVKDDPQASTSKEDLLKQKTVSTERISPREEQICS